VYEDQGLTDPPLQLFKGILFPLCPLPLLPFLREIVERAGHFGERLDESTIEVAESDELSHCTDCFGRFPFLYSVHLRLFHLESLRGDLDPEEFHSILVELAFLCVSE
jgi:hypothetical protein